MICNDQIYQENLFAYFMHAYKKSKMLTPFMLYGSINQ